MNEILMVNMFEHNLTEDELLQAFRALDRLTLPVFPMLGSTSLVAVPDEVTDDPQAEMAAVE